MMSRWWLNFEWYVYFLFTYKVRIKMSFTTDQLAKLQTLAQAVADASALETKDDAAKVAADLAVTARDSQFTTDSTALTTVQAAALATLQAQQASDTAVLRVAYDGDKKALALTAATAAEAATADDGATKAAVDALIAYATNPS
jgi:hypothetical protein